MKCAIIASKKDPAGMNIVENLKKLNCPIPIYIIEKEITRAENIDKHLNCEFIIFVSKHKAENNKKSKKSLTIHSIGNFHKAKFGGKSKTLVKSDALLFKHFFQKLNEINDSHYLITMEATHHGPYINNPCLFIEIGPSILEWVDKNAGKIIAKTIIESIDTFKKKNYKIALGFGGPHYCNNFNEIQLENKYAISHIAPSYVFPINEKLIKNIIEKTYPDTTIALIDWKGLKSKERNILLETLKKYDLEIIKTKDAKNS